MVWWFLLMFPSCDSGCSVVFERIAHLRMPLARKFRLESAGLRTIDLDRTSAPFDPSDGSAPQEIRCDDTVPCEAGTERWPFNEDLTHLVLCGPACARGQVSPSGRVSVTVTCGTRERDRP